MFSILFSNLDLKLAGGKARMKKKDEWSKKLSELAKRFAKSGLRLTDGSGKVKAVAFVGGVQKPENSEPCQ
jgi:hypothetical protein